MSTVLLGQALLGASLSASFSRAYEIRMVVLTGFFSGWVPAMDWIYRTMGPPVDSYAQKGWITYSLLFIPIGALFSASAVFAVRRLMEGRQIQEWRARREPRFSSGRVLVSRQFEMYRDTKVPPVGPPLTFGRLYGFALLGMTAPGIFRAAGSDGAALLWPFFNERIVKNLFHAFDPVVLILLISGIAFALFLRDKKPARWGVLALLLYSLIAMVQRDRAESALRNFAAEQNHHIAAMEVLPTWGNLNLKRGLYLRSEGNLYICAINLPLIGGARVYPGPNFTPLQPGRHLPGLPEESSARRQLESLVKAARGFATVQEIEGVPHAVDLRRSPLPHSGLPKVALALPGQGQSLQPKMRLPLRNFEETSALHRLTFFRLWMGQDLPEDAPE